VKTPQKGNNMSDYYENDGTFSSDDWNLFAGTPFYYENDGTGTTTTGEYTPGIGNIYYENDGTASTDSGGGGVGAGNIGSGTALGDGTSGSIVNLLKSLFSDGKGGLDILKLGALGGGVAGLLGGNKSSSTPSGYQGSIPKYTATRNMVTAPQAGRRPGAGGTRYGGDVSFTPKGSSPIGGGLAGCEWKPRSYSRQWHDRSISSSRKQSPSLTCN
jgi:hypothetical protein